MKKLLTFILCLVFVSCKYDVEKQFDPAPNPYAGVDLKSQRVPDSIRSSKQIALFLTKNLTNTKDQVRAIHFWIANNIAYDTLKINSTTSDTEKLIQETLDDKSGVCHHYSELFHQMCQEIGVNSFYIGGYTIAPSTRKIADESHAWNGIQIDSNYYFLDNTWAAGYFSNKRFKQDFRDDYFLVSPKEFIKSHMPYNDFFQFLNNPISYADFEKGNFSKLTQKGNFNYNDSIIKFQSLSQLDKFQEENKKLKQDNTNNPFISEKINYNTLNIDTIIYNSMARKYSTANAKMKLAFSLNNQFIDFMNSRTVETEEIKNDMQNLVRKVVKNYKQAKALLNELKQDKRKLSEQSALHNLVNPFITSLNKNIQTLRESLQLHALYADLKIN